MQGRVAKALGITGTQLKTWRLEIEAFGSAEAKRRQKADAAELERLRKENKRHQTHQAHEPPNTLLIDQLALIAHNAKQ